MEKGALEKLLDLQIENEKKYWIIFDWLKREFFVLLKDKITNIDWTENWLNDLQNLHKNVIEEWKEIENVLPVDFPIKRLKEFYMKFYFI